MVGHSADLSEIRNSTGVRTHAGHRRRLVASAGRSIVGVVVTRNSTTGTAIASGHSGYHQFGKAVASYRENPRSHGAETTDGRGRSFRTDDDIVEHLQRRKSNHGDGDVGHSTIVECNETSLKATNIILWLENRMTKFICHILKKL